MMIWVYKSQASLTSDETTLEYVLLNIVKLFTVLYKEVITWQTEASTKPKKACSFVPSPSLCSSVNPQSKPAKVYTQYIHTVRVWA